jgi:hypothetical protein
MFVIWKRSGERAQVRFMWGCLGWSIVVSIEASARRPGFDVLGARPVGPPRPRLDPQPKKRDLIRSALRGGGAELLVDIGHLTGAA